ncbi:hypothetical protein BCF59_0558 [Mycoplasmopsis mustelae]|uniref:Lipoprotein n=1 Tax=Mycoplasmopsis mustelae TaxID=171289 RepID=A0A4R7UCA2_9BACT|nr:hypothetical protein [Mycoplasmopsis mustelae]TDV23567.1 hypothetical protein BCF59_0558 [Mycoplasmopsis mustelae]
MKKIHKMLAIMLTSTISSITAISCVDSVSNSKNTKIDDIHNKTSKTKKDDASKAEDSEINNEQTQENKQKNLGIKSLEVVNSNNSYKLIIQLIDKLDDSVLHGDIRLKIVGFPVLFNKSDYNQESKTLSFDVTNLASYNDSNKDNEYGIEYLFINNKKITTNLKFILKKVNTESANTESNSNNTGQTGGGFSSKTTYRFI